MTDNAPKRFIAPNPTSYHRTIANRLERRFPDHWRWIASDEAAEAAQDALRLDLLSRTYRLDRATHAALYADVDALVEQMALGAPATLYQTASTTAAGQARNAALYFEPTAAHIVFSGDVLQALTPGELRFVIGHELAHHRLWTLDDGRAWIAFRLLDWASREQTCPPSWLESARLERLYTEVYADRFGLWAVGDLEQALAAQIKLATGMNEVSGAAFLAQAEEALEGRGEIGSDGGSHPEGFLRAALLATWAHDPNAADARAKALLEGATPLEKLDLLGQERVSDLTFWMLYEFLTEPWASRPLIKQHAQEISKDLAQHLAAQRREPDDLEVLRTAIATCPQSIRTYFAYLLLDFASVDPQLDDVMLTAALTFAADFGLSAELKTAAAKELKITKTKLGELERNAESILAKAELALADEPEPHQPSLDEAQAARRGAA